MDTNSSNSEVIDAAIATGKWIDVGAVYAPQSGPEWTYGGEKNWDKISPGSKVTRPDRVLANRIGAQMILGFETVKDSTAPNHLPLKITLSVRVIMQQQTVMVLPRRYPMELQRPMDKEQKEELARSILAPKREAIKAVREARMPDQAWRMAAEIAEEYMENLCSHVEKEQGERGRCRPLVTKTEKTVAAAGRRCPDCPRTTRVTIIQLARNKAIEIEKKR